MLALACKRGNDPAVRRSLEKKLADVHRRPEYLMKFRDAVPGGRVHTITHATGVMLGSGGRRTDKTDARMGKITLVGG
jgi:hypothetical protein